MKVFKTNSILRAIGKKKIRSGDLRSLVKIFDSEKVPDDHVGFTVDVEPVAESWAKVVVNSISVTTGEDENEDGSVFVLRSVEFDAPPDTSMLILHDDVFYQVVGYAEVGDKAEYYAVACLVQGAVSKLDITAENESGDTVPVTGDSGFWEDGY